MFMRNIVMSTSVYVCLSARISSEFGTTRAIFTKLLCMLLMAVARFSSSSNFCKFQLVFNRSNMASDHWPWSLVHAKYIQILTDFIQHVRAFDSGVFDFKLWTKSYIEYIKPNLSVCLFVCLSFFCSLCTATVMSGPAWNVACGILIPSE